MSSPNLKARHWSASSTAEKKKLAPHSPSWRGLAGTAEILLRTRGRKRLCFPESYDDDDSDDESSSECEELTRPLPRKRKQVEEATGGGALPDNKRAICEMAALKDIFERNASCQICQGPVNVEFPSCCLATWTKVSCKKKDCSYFDNGQKPQPADVPELPNQGSALIERTTDYALNVLYVLGFMGCGDGGREAARVLGFDTGSIPTVT